MRSIWKVSFICWLSYAYILLVDAFLASHPSNICMSPPHLTALFHTNPSSSTSPLQPDIQANIPATSNAPLSSNYNQIRTSDVFSLDSIRSTLIRQEETIIFALIERAQYRSNRVIYQANSLDFKGVNKENISFFDWMLLETEKLHAQVRRYTSPEEHPFNIDAIPQQPLRLPKLNYPSLLGTEKEKVNVNNEIKSWYIDKLIPRLCVDGDDEQYGSTVMADIAVVQALSRRIHYGKFVAESKYLKEGVRFEEYIRQNDVKGIIDLLTNVEVERRVLRRAFVKASTYGQDIIQDPATVSSSASSTGYKVDPSLIVEIYRDMIIPLTKDVEVRYLYHRVGYNPPHSSSYFHLCRGPMDAFDDPDALKRLAVS
jgi:chorismate mutase